MIINKTNLIHALKKSSELSYREASFCVGFLLEAISDGISKGERIELRGLGSFEMKQVAAKKYPSAWSEKPLVPAHGRIVFRPCENLRRAVWNRGVKE
jgi:nucleoid DNA-binding protein